MDTSETYIKMCEKAEEIQNLRPNHTRLSNVCVVEEFTESLCPKCQTEQDTEFCPDCGSKVEKGHPIKKVQERILQNPFDESIWLPRQDQLQEMIEAVDTSPYKLHIALTWWLESIVGLPPPFTSMEQLWLAFVMKEKFGKVWSNDDWVKETPKGL